MATQADRAPADVLDRARADGAHALVAPAVPTADEELAKPARHAQPRPELCLPALFVALEKALVEAPGLEALDQGVGGERGREQAVEDTAARGRLREAAGVTHEEEPIGHRLRRGLQGQEAPHRPARLATQPRPHLGPGEKPR